jgi:hypothetical protein
MRHVLDTEGGRALVVELRKNVFRAYKRHLQQPLCASVIEGCPCPDGQQCLHIHVTPEGYADRRLWVDPAHRPRPVSEATAHIPGGAIFAPFDSRPLPPLPPVAQDGGRSTELGTEFRPCGPYLPSPYLKVSLPPPAAAQPAPRCHGAVPTFPHDDRAVTQQRASRLRRQVRTDVDLILTQIPSTGNIYILPHVLASPHALQLPTGPQPYSPAPLPVFPSAGPYAPSSPFVHPIPPAHHYSVPYPPCGSPRRPTWDLGDSFPERALHPPPVARRMPPPHAALRIVRPVPRIGQHPLFIG